MDLVLLEKNSIPIARVVLVIFCRQNALASWCVCAIFSVEFQLFELNGPVPWEDRMGT